VRCFPSWCPDKDDNLSTVSPGAVAHRCLGGPFDGVSKAGYIVLEEGNVLGAGRIGVTHKRGQQGWDLPEIPFRENPGLDDEWTSQPIEILALVVRMVPVCS
jgi:hypothetical protein